MNARSHRALTASFVLLAACAAAACGDSGATETTASSTTTGAGGSGGGTGGSGGAGGSEPPPVCGTGNRALKDGLVELSYDDGVADTSLREQMFTIEISGTKYPLNEQVLHEAVRFELDHPAKIHGFSVQWSGLPEGVDPKRELAAGLYPDFGYNGFDYWSPAPYWTGTRCAEDVKPGEWLTYAFDQPIEIAHPGLVYVAHEALTVEDPVFAFDGSVIGEGTCEKWDDCHSSINMPEVEKKQYYNGTSFPFQYDYLVRLYVEYTDDVKPEEKVFQPKPFPKPSGHVAWGDFDDDGWDDLIAEGPTLYRNKGDGSFEDVTAKSGIAGMGLATTGGVWGDYDNDGCLDLFLFAESYTAPDALLRSNCDGTFADATATAGIVDQQSYNGCGDPANNVRSPSAAAAWLDVDADGLLDLYVANFICWANYTYYTDTVWHNEGNGAFAEWTAKNGFLAKKTASRGAAPADMDNDGDVDLFINNYVLQANLLYVNNGNGTVTEAAIGHGAAGHKDGASAYYGHTIGAAWGDLDADGDLDLISANLAHPRFFDFSDKTEVLINDGAGNFHDLGGDWKEPKSAAGLRYQETHSVPCLADFDQDGALDLVITAVYDGRPTDFYWGKGDGTFRLDAYHSGITTENGWGVAAADYDHDGDPDLFASTLFENANPPAPGHWIQARVIGNVGANRAGIGASVRAMVGAKTLLRHVQGGTGKGGQDSQYLHFGLGSATSVDTLSVTFPGGKKVDFAGPFAADKRYWLFEDGSTAEGWAPPAKP